MYLEVSDGKEGGEWVATGTFVREWQSLNKATLEIGVSNSTRFGLAESGERSSRCASTPDFRP